MRVAVITQDWPGFVGGGVATLASVLAEGLAECGVDAEVWTRGGGARAGRASSASIPVVAFDGRSWKRRGTRHWSRGVHRARARFRPDLAVVTTWDPMPGVLASAPDLPVRCFAFGRDVTGLLDQPYRSRARAAVVSDSRVSWLTLTHWMSSELVARGVPEGRVRRVRPGVFRPRGCSVRSRAVSRLLTVGRLVARKGQDRTIQALALLEGRFPELRYSVVGDGPDRDRLEELAHAEGVADRVDFHGRLVGEDLEAAYAAADLFVMPARSEPGGDTEGYGLVYLEAGARGLAVVGGASAGAREAVDHEQTGLLVDRPESVEAVASALSRAIDRPIARMAWAREGRRRYEEHGTPDAFATAVIE